MKASGQYSREQIMEQQRERSELWSVHHKEGRKKAEEHKEAKQNRIMQGFSQTQAAIERQTFRHTAVINRKIDIAHLSQSWDNRESLVKPRLMAQTARDHYSRHQRFGKTAFLGDVVPYGAAGSSMSGKKGRADEASNGWASGSLTSRETSRGRVQRVVTSPVEGNAHLGLPFSRAARGI